MSQILKTTKRMQTVSLSLQISFYVIKLYADELIASSLRQTVQSPNQFVSLALKCDDIVDVELSHFPRMPLCNHPSCTGYFSVLIFDGRDLDPVTFELDVLLPFHAVVLQHKEKHEIEQVQ